MRTADVHLLGPRRIFRDLIDVGHRGEMDDHVAAVDGGVHRILVAQVADRVLERMAVQVGRFEQVEVSGLMAGREHPVDDMRADEAGAARDKHFH